MDNARLTAMLETLLVPSAGVPLSALAQSASRAGLPRDLAGSVFEQRGILLEALGDEADAARVVDALTRRFVEYVQGKNQFLPFSSDWPTLRSIFHGALVDVRGAIAESASATELDRLLRRALGAHLARLDELVRSLCPEPDRADDVLGAEPTSDEYSAELQLSVLRLELLDLMEPVLDVGCGTGASLVHYLRAYGLEAHGIDLVVPNDPPLAQADWMTYAYGVSRWGTVIAHMSFTNHFVFQDQCSEEQAEKYALTYMRILRSLKPGGAFHYAPAVPFIERHLPGEFLITRRPVAALSGPETTAGEQPSEERWHELVCAVRVHKRR
ncbi:MAG: class I SAM-dependent methyltransferase [Polyangiaceae bacterium]|nr:class I SAM-dependent methyltransferase [Polyangiaceae bacterium]